MRHAGLGVALQEHALEPDPEATEIGVDTGLDAVAHEIERNRASQQLDEKQSPGDEDDRRQRQENQRRRFQKSPQTAQPRLKISPMHRHAWAACAAEQTIGLRPNTAGC